MQQKDIFILFLIFASFFKISLFVIGGGLAMIPVIEDIFVKKHKLLKEQDIFDMMAVSQTIPGLIAINCAIFVGTKFAGLFLFAQSLFLQSLNLVRVRCFSKSSFSYFCIFYTFLKNYLKIKEKQALQDLYKRLISLNNIP